MTVCIAAICRDQGEEKIVLCSDRKLSSPLGSSETGNKILYIGKGWRLLTAGDQPEIMALWRLYRLRFKKQENRTADLIDESVKLPLRQRKKELSDEYTYSRFNMSFDEFAKSGKAMFPDDEYRNAIRAIRDLDLGASLIVAGFIDGSPEIYWTDQYGTARPASDFAIVGEGQHLAQSVLLRREQRFQSSLYETLYNVYEAKRYSQAVGSVGEQTLLTVLSADGRRELSSHALDRKLEKLYKVYGPRDLPGDFELERPLYYSEEQAIRKAAEAAALEGQAAPLPFTEGSGNAEGSSTAASTENPTDETVPF